MRLACYEDFELEPGLYWPAYQDFPYFEDRARFLRERWPSARILVAGCGWGYTVAHGLALGLDIWGCDASIYALQKATDVLSTEARARIIEADVTIGVDGSYDLIVTEDMLPMLTGDEITAALGVLRSRGVVKHWVTPTYAPAPHPSIQTQLDAGQWGALLAPDEVWIVGS